MTIIVEYLFLKKIGTTLKIIIFNKLKDIRKSYRTNVNDITDNY